MKIEIQDMRGNYVGTIQLSQTPPKDADTVKLEWSSKIRHTKNTFTARMKSIVLPLKPVVRLKWKEREKETKWGRVVLPWNLAQAFAEWFSQGTWPEVRAQSKEEKKAFAEYKTKADAADAKRKARGFP